MLSHKIQRTRIHETARPPSISPPRFFHTVYGRAAPPRRMSTLRVLAHPPHRAQHPRTRIAHPPRRSQPRTQRAAHSVCAPHVALAHQLAHCTCTAREYTTARERSRRYCDDGARLPLLLSRSRCAILPQAAREHTAHICSIRSRAPLAQHTAQTHERAGVALARDKAMGLRRRAHEGGVSSVRRTERAAPATATYAVRDRIGACAQAGGAKTVDARGGRRAGSTRGRTARGAGTAR
ncbi:hypothetical protein HYPSUDRAFT_200333 [Hypholoma sublateritium FD-334 SS-4]|uniref:Uncharacterized protein n=1 Tax=Hypholoma sublateritium (strain FD-334 SS-4) TaxID=945553 RepID=A0A0D2P826_HYPSF|nr:hypothetical protein HYPSUDRAFT_200333 [Hypholoma sublateritium FD-334 SS-4]